jgi:glycosyltransferase involved in cell wall biosynthesis
MTTDSKIRVMQVIAGASFGGAETFFSDLVVALQGMGLDQVVVTRPNAKRIKLLQDAGITNIETLPFGTPWRDRQTRKKLAQLIQQYKPDIVQTWMTRATILCPDSKRAKHDFVHVGWMGGYYNLSYFQKCHHLIGVTFDIARSLIRQGWPQNRGHYFRTFAAVQPGKKLNRKDYNTPDDAPLLFALGRMHAKKGFDTLLMTLRLLPDAYLWLAGDGPLMANLQKFAHDIGVADRVRFLGWRSDRGDLFATADICVVPSRFEPFGTVVVEAWANRIPLVATMAAGPSATVRHEVDGMLVPIDDIDAIAQAVRRLLKDGHLRERLVANAYVHYLSDFTQSAVADSYLQFYQDIIELQPQILQEMADAEQQLTRREKWRKRLNWLLRAGCW